MSPNPPRALWAGRTLALVGIVLVAFNLRTAVASLSPIIVQLEAEIPLAPVVVGFLGMLPPLCYAVFGILTPLFAKRFGLEVTPHRLARRAHARTARARGSRDPRSGSSPRARVTFAAIGVGNVLLPAAREALLPRSHRPHDDDLRDGDVDEHVHAAAHRRSAWPMPRAGASRWASGRSSPRCRSCRGSRCSCIRSGRRPRHCPRRPIAGTCAVRLRSPLAWSLAVVFAMSGFNATRCSRGCRSILHDTRRRRRRREAGALLALYAAMGLPAGFSCP